MAAEEHDAKTTFVDNIQKVSDHLKEGQYRICANLASEMTHFSCLLGQKDWVFVCEVFESIYGNLYHLSKHHILSGTDEKSIRAALVQHTDIILNALTNGDADKIYQTLKQMRFDTTKLQLKMWATHSEFPVPPS